MDARAGVIGLLIQLLQIAREPNEVVALGNAVDEGAEQRRDRIVLDGLEHQLRGWRGAPTDAGGVAGAEDRGGDVRAVPGVHIGRAIVDDRLEAEVRRAGAVEDGVNAAGGDIGMRAERGAGAEPRIGDRDDLRRSVEAAVVGGPAAENDAAAELVVLHAKREGFDAGHARERGEGLRLITAGGDDQEPGAAPRHPYALCGERSRELVDVGIALDPEDERLLSIVGPRPGELRRRSERRQCGHEGQRPDRLDLLRAEPRSEREVRHVFEQGSAGLGRGRLPGLLHRSLELQQVVPIGGCGARRLWLHGDDRRQGTRE